MGNESSDIDFAVIGHQDCWKKITCFVDFLSDDKRKLSAEKISEIYSFIPPRKLFDIEVNSSTGQKVTGCYIESFISPGELGKRYWKKNVIKVREAVNCARKLNANISALGGFTSIVLEGKDDSLNEGSSTKFTTGNSLTSAFIVKGLEKACIKFDKPLERQRLLIIGSNGDIGLACVQYFSGKVKELLLCTRHDDITHLLPRADLIISVASSTIDHFHPSLCRESVIICDAGYPKNLAAKHSDAFDERLYCGGMGHVKGGFQFTPSIHHDLYNFPLKNIAHGCMLEGVVLAFEKLYYPFSQGRGNITKEKIELIYSLAQKHGITVAPLYNSGNSW